MHKTPTGLIVPEIIENMIQAKINALRVMSPYIKVDTTLVGKPGDRITVNGYTYIGDAEDINPYGDDFENADAAKLKNMAKQFEVKVAGKKVDVYDYDLEVADSNAIDVAVNQLATAIFNKQDNDLLEAALKSSNIVDGKAKEINYNGIVHAVCRFLDEDTNTEKVIFIHPLQMESLLTDPLFISADKFESGVAVRGAIGKIAGCWVKTSLKIPVVDGVFRCPIIKLEPDNSETEMTEAELPAIKLIEKTGVNVKKDVRPLKTRLSATKIYGAALTNEGKVLVAEFKAQDGAADIKRPKNEAGAVDLDKVEKVAPKKGDKEEK